MVLFPGRRKKNLAEIGRFVLHNCFSLMANVGLFCSSAAIVQLVELYQVENLKISPSKIQAAVGPTEINPRVQRNQSGPKVVKKLQENRPKSYCEFKITPTLQMMISDCHLVKKLLLKETKAMKTNIAVVTMKLLREKKKKLLR